MAHVKGDSIDQSDEWSVVLPEVETKIPTFGIDEEALTPEQIEAARILAEGSQTPEQIEAARVLAEQQQQTPEQIEAARIAALETRTPEQIATDLEVANKIRKELLAEMGLESVEEAKKLKNPDKPETEEEKTKRLERQEASFQQYAVQHDKLSLNEINSYKQLSAMAPIDLVFADFANEYRTEHKDRMEDGKADPVTDDEIRSAFDVAYQTTAEIGSIKKAGERAIAARAKELLGQTESKYNSAKTEFEALESRRLKMPEFKSFVQGALKEAIIPAMKYTVDGRDINVELDGKDFAEIEGKFKDDQIFAKFFANTDRQGLKTSITLEAERQLAAKYIKKVAEVSNRLGYDAGVKDGKIGAREPFDPTKKQTLVNQNAKLTEEEKANIRSGIGSR